MKLVREKRGFRLFLTSRALLAAVPLATPFHALLAYEITSGAIGGLAVFVIATGLSQVVSSPVWGRFSDKSSRKVMIVAGMLGGATGALALLIAAAPEGWRSVWVVSTIFVLGAFAHAGCRLGRKTYLVDGAPKDERPLYVAIANTLMGVVILAGGALGVMAEVIGLPTLIGTLAVVSVLGAAAAWLAPEAEEMSA